MVKSKNVSKYADRAKPATSAPLKYKSGLNFWLTTNETAPVDSKLIEYAAWAYHYKTHNITVQRVLNPLKGIQNYEK